MKVYASNCIIKSKETVLGVMFVDNFVVAFQNNKFIFFHDKHIIYSNGILKDKSYTVEQIKEYYDAAVYFLKDECKLENESIKITTFSLECIE